MSAADNGHQPTADVELLRQQITKLEHEKNVLEAGLHLGDE